MSLTLGESGLSKIDDQPLEVSKKNHSVINPISQGSDSYNKHLKNVVVGEIISINTVFQSTGLRDIAVNCGGKPLKTVSLASNLKVGSKIAFAKLGAILKGSDYVQIEEIGGIETHGRLCSSFDLDLGDVSKEVLELPPNSIVGTELSDLIRIKSENR